MALYSELPIYKHGCDLLSLALDVQTQMPRVFKRSLGEKIHGLCVDMLEAMAMANASRGHTRVQQLDMLLQHLRATTAMLRVSHDKRLISPKLWAQSVELLAAVGSQAGGVAVYGQCVRGDSFWRGWAPLPKTRIEFKENAP